MLVLLVRLVLLVPLIRLVSLAAGDDFFAAGGTSLTAVRALARIRERVGGELGLADLMEDPTPVGLAARIGTASPHH